MEQLYILTGNRDDLVEYRLGDTCDSIPADELKPYCESLDGAEGDLEGLTEALKDVMDSHPENSAVIDRDAAVLIHEYLDISRRHASHPGLWHWLCIVKFPEFVRYRWSLDGAIKEKFLKAGTDIYSNALHRLWWFAELTREGDDYSRTRKLLDEGNQYIANRIADRSFARHDTAVKVFVDLLIDEDSEIVENVAKEFRHRETNYNIESMTRGEIKGVLQSLLQEVRPETPSN